MVIERKKGFTLIELLVVIAIIAIMAAILFPVFMEARRKAYSTKCSANLKQIGVSLTLYLDDNGGRFCPWAGAPATSSNPSGSAWIQLLQKYSKTKLMGQCAANENARGNKSVSYWKNVYTDYWAGGLAGGPPAPLYSSFRNIRSTVYMMDGPSQYNDGIHTWWGPPTQWAPFSGGSYTTKDALASEERHGGAANVLFIDGHVALVRPKQWKTTVTGTAHTNPLPSNPWGYPSGMWAERGDGSNPWFRGD